MAELKLGNIKPVGADNVVVEGKYVKGGYVVVATIEERNALKGANGENIVKGSLCFCQADSKFYLYNGTSWDEQTVVADLSDHINTKTGNPHGVTKANVGLGSVVNTGDSATPVSGGTTKFTTGGAYTELNKKVDKVTGKGLSTNDYTTAEKNKLAGIASNAEVNVQSDWGVTDTSSDAFIKNKPTLGSLAAKSTVAKSDLATDVQTSLGKADTALQSFTESDPTVPSWAKAATKPSYNLGEVADTTDYVRMTSAERTKLSGVATGANKITVDSALSSTSTNPVQNKVVNSALAGKANSSHTHTKSEITDFPELATVATSGSYNDLSAKPTIPTKSSWNYDDSYVKYSAAQSLTANQKSQARSNIGAGTSNFSGNYNDLTNKPTIPTIPSISIKETEQSGSSRPSPSDGDQLAFGQTIAFVDELSASGHEITATVSAYKLPSVDTELSATSTNPVQNKVIYNALNDKVDSATGKADRVVITDTNGDIAVSDISTVELGYLDGVTRNIQTQLNGKPNNVDLANYVPTTRTVNGKALSSDITLNAADVGALPSTTTIPTVNNGTLTIQKNGTTVKTFTANSSSDVTANITVPTKVSELTNDSGFKTTDNNTTYDLSASANSTNGNVKLNLTAGGSGSGTDSVTIKGSGTTSVTTDSNGVIVVKSSDHPTALKNPKALTIGGKSYDGSSAVSVSASDLGIANAIHFVGETTTTLTDGATTTPVTVGNESVTPVSGDVVLYSSKEFIWNGSAWKELGDGASHALKTVTITAGNGLTGGGDLSTNRTLNVGAGNGITVSADAVAAKAGSGITVDSTGINHADTSSQASVTANGRKYITGVTLDTYGHVTGLTTGTESVTDTNQKVKVGTTTFGANDTVEFVAGSNVTLTPDATNDKITIAATDTVYTHPTYTAHTGKPTANQTPAFGGTATVSQITSDATGHVTNMTDRTIKIPDTLSNGTSTAGLIKTSSTVTSNSGYTACPVISGVPYYKDTNTVYTHPTPTKQNTSSLVKIAVDNKGHVTDTVAVTKADITALGIPSQDTQYTHPSHTARSNGLYKITVDNKGHVTDVAAVAKSDITALGIPGQDTNTTYTAGTGLSLDGTKFANEAALHYAASITVDQAGSSTKDKYLASKWSVDNVDGITTPVDGMSIAIRTPDVGFSGGILFSIDGGTTYYPIVRNTNTLVTTTYTAGSTIIVTFNATQTASPYTTAGTTSTITGCWQTADYDANTKTTTGTSNKASTKLYLAGATSQSSSGATTYSNSKVYIGTDNCLYSNSEKVSTAGHTHDYSGTTGNTKAGITVASADAGHTHTFSANLASGSAASAGAHTHTVTPTGTVTSTDAGHYHAYEASLTNGKAESAGAHTHTLTANGTVTIVEPTANNSKGHTHTASSSHSLTAAAQTFKGTAATSGAPNDGGTTTVASLSHTHSYTPAGSVSSHSHTVTAQTSTVNSLTGVGTLPSHTNASLSLSASNKRLTITFSGGGFSTGSLPTYSPVTVVTGVNSSTGSTQPTFTGTAATIAKTGTTGTTVANSTHTHNVTATGTNAASSVTGTITTTVAKAQTGVTATFSGSSATTSSAGSHTHTVTGSISGDTDDAAAVITSTFAGNSNTTSSTGAHTHNVSGSVSGTSGSGKASITNTVTDPGHTHSYSGTSGGSN